MLKIVYIDSVKKLILRAFLYFALFNSLIKTKLLHFNCHAIVLLTRRIFFKQVSIPLLFLFWRKNNFALVVLFPDLLDNHHWFRQVT